MDTRVSQYKYVLFISDRFKTDSSQQPLQEFKSRKSTPWKAYLVNKDKSQTIIGYYETDRDAAIAVDKELIKQGKPPVNILIPAKKIDKAINEIADLFKEESNRGGSNSGNSFSRTQIAEHGTSN